MIRFVGKLLFRICSLIFIFSFLLALFLPINEDMIEMVKNNRPVWFMQLSRLWGNSVNQCDETTGNRTVLQWAAVKTKNPEVISFLVENGADVNQTFETSKAPPLQFALEQNKNPEIIKRLLDVGADPNLRLDDGRTLFHIAAVYAEDETILDAFAQHGVDLFAVDTENQADALHWAGDHNNNLSIIKKLVSMGLNVESTDGMSRTPLMKAATRNANPEVIKFLIEKGAFIDAQDKNWDTALIRGCKENKNPDVLMVLLDSGANVNLFNNEQRRAIDFARQNNALKNSEFLRKLERMSN